MSALVLKIFLLLACSALVRQSIIYAGQHWARTFSHTITILTLPIITFTITSVISGNIALSLGLVGALSIVRFRNPVKSPFELVVYFLMIVCGIAISVDPAWLIVLVAAFVLITIACEAANRISKRTRGEALFPASFAEGNALSTLTVFTSGTVASLDAHNALVGYSFDETGGEYRLVSPARAELAALAQSLRDAEGVRRIDFQAP